MSSTTREAVEIGPYLEQEPFLQGEKRYYGFVSGVGAGKTMAGIIRTARNLIEWNPGEMGAIIAPTRQMVVNVIIPEMRDLGLLDVWEYKSAYSDEPGIHTPEGSRALILSADNERAIERLRGLNLAWGWIDEEAVVNPRAREILMQRLRTGEYRNMYITTTPKGKNHTYDFFVGDVDAREYAYGDATIYETDDRLAVTGVPSWANPHTPEDYHEAMDSLPEQIRAQEVEGTFIEIGAGIFNREMFHFTTPDELPDRKFQYIMGVDVGVEADRQRARQNDTDYWAVVLLAIDQMSGTALVVDCHRERGMTLREGLAWLSSLSDGFNPKLFIESNQSQRWLQQEASQQGLNAHAVMNQRNKEERIIQMSIPIERGTVKFVNREIDRSIGYDPRFKDLFGELLGFPEAAHDDLADALQIAIDNAPIGGETSMFGGDMYGVNSDA